MVRYKTERKRPKRVVNNKNSLQQQAVVAKSAPKFTSDNFSCSFLTVILIMCLIQISISAVVNISKVVSYNAKIKQITNIRNAALDLNNQLNDSIKNFGVASYEAIGRNNLKMASKDELTVIINPPKTDENEQSDVKKNVFLKFNQNN
ncbi:MAG: hypothetical protein MJ237_01300 [bacterium]|nr:hypothetical protein [bacterium]